MLQRLAIAIYLLTMTEREIYCACGEGGDPIPIADREIFSLLAKFNPLNRLYFTARDTLLIFTVIERYLF
ncbi:hypothetical protein Q6268_28445 [Klebsiella pneumoniae]|uniref:hypothetical protein n=1 Tax=Klebsiella pneumoniae TaxID=573 RepID=UPI0027321ADB|nr:hypothetical protein [Klebsiella pneumoniae]MDP1211552.1 hypothetical protein [Klebsiella pneumoniae]